MIVIEQESMDYLLFLLYLGKRKRISYLRDNEMGQEKILRIRRDETGRDGRRRCGTRGQDGTLKKELSGTGRDGTGQESTGRGTGRDEFLVIPRSSGLYYRYFFKNLQDRN